MNALMRVQAPEQAPGRGGPRLPPELTLREAFRLLREYFGVDVEVLLFVPRSGLPMILSACPIRR